MNRKPSNKTLIIIAGPTAVGKTAAAIQLALHYKTVIISADSRQFFKEMSIGTSKPSADELAAVKHYFIDSHSVKEKISVGDFETACLALLNNLFKTYDVVIMAGGSGLYIKAVCEGFDDLPVADDAIRESLNKAFEENGIAWLQEKLKGADPAYYKKVDINNPQRMIRALEVFEGTGKTITSFQKAAVKKRSFNIIKIGLTLPRDILYERINRRVDNMIKQGLVDEVKSLLPYRHLNALNTVGYTELFDHLDGNITLESAVDSIKQNTRKFAKRQLTWFRKDKDIQWINSDEHLLSIAIAKV